MVKGKITLRIRKRRLTESAHYKDKWEEVGQLRLYCSKNNTFIAESKFTGKMLRITRDELAFVKSLFMFFGNGDYNIQLYGKGNIRGYRRFWDGVITEDGKFIRRTEAHFANAGSYSSLSTNSINTESFIGRYMKTKKPGNWYNL